MSELIKCCGSGCTLKRICYRYTSVPDFMQSEFNEPPFVSSDNDFQCDYFIADDEDENTEQIKNFLDL